MGRSDISVDTEGLRSLSKKISNASDVIKREFNKLYSIVEEINSGWDDESSSTFVARIKDYKPSFDELTEVINNYSITTEKTAAEYENTIKNITSIAGKI